LVLAQSAVIEKVGRPDCIDGHEPAMAVIGYGKLGSFELGVASDLDIVFLYESAAESGVTTQGLPNETYFARVAQRLIHLLNTRTPAGILYEVDTRLRPSGHSGPLVTSVAAFANYQRQHAWTWEHQALVRARFIAGSVFVGEEFSKIRHEILVRARDEGRLKQDVREMRSRMLKEHGSKTPKEFQLKHDPGGIVDIEFMVQYAVLRWAHDVPALADSTDNLTILKTLKDGGRLPAAAADTLSEAFAHYLALEHHAKLMERKPVFVPAELVPYPEKVRAVWNELLGDK
jgi:glutamate-ammonia-ligase adenylyltransferase